MAAYTGRSILKSGETAAGVLVAGSIRHARAQSGPIRLGYVAPLSGVQQAVGQPSLITAQVSPRNGRALECRSMRSELGLS